MLACLLTHTVTQSHWGQLAQCLEVAAAALPQTHTHTPMIDRTDGAADGTDKEQMREVRRKVIDIVKQQQPISLLIELLLHLSSAL